MKINEKLNLVLPVVSDDKGVVVRGYHVPISREVFEASFRILAATKASLSSKGSYFLMDSGPRIATLTLRDEGRQDAAERGDFDAKGNPGDGGAEALLLEIKRLTTIMAPTSNGWDFLPVDTAIQQGILDEDDWREAESAIVFFTAHSALAKKADRAGVTRATTSLLKASTTSLPPMEYANSLLTSTTAEATEGKAVSSVPS